MRLRAIFDRLSRRPQGTEQLPVVPEPEPEPEVSSADEVFERLAKVDYERPRRRSTSRPD